MEKKEILKTSQEYLAALKAMRPNIIRDRLLEEPYEDEDIQKGVNVVGVTYDQARDPQCKGHMAIESPEIGCVVNRYNHVPRTRQEMTTRLTMINCLTKQVGCVQRCVGGDALWALHVGTYRADKANNFETEYHQRFLRYLAYIQENDIAPAGAVTDGKGDRSKPPSKQPAPNSYVRIVEERPDGIVVSGIKTPITMSLYTEELIALPGLQYGKSDSDCAVAFAIPADAEGVERYVLGPDVVTLHGEFCATHGRKYLNKEGMVIFNNVFIPNERIFLKGEFNFAAVYADLFATLHRFSYTACKPALYDLMTGAAMLITDYNGTKGEYFLSNNSDKILDIYKTSIMVQAMQIAAIQEAKETESGVLFPDPVYSNMGKYLSSQNFHTAIATLQDLAGALPTNMPYPELLSDPEYGEHVRDLFARKKGVSAEDHYRVNELIRTFVASNESGLLQFGSKHGGGNKEAEKVAIYGYSIRKLNECKKIFKKMAFED